MTPKSKSDRRDIEKAVKQRFEELVENWSFSDSKDHNFKQLAETKELLLDQRLTTRNALLYFTAWVDETKMLEEQQKKEIKSRLLSLYSTLRLESRLNKEYQIPCPLSKVNPDKVILWFVCDRLNFERERFPDWKSLKKHIQSLCIEKRQEMADCLKGQEESGGHTKGQKTELKKFYLDYYGETTSISYKGFTNKYSNLINNTFLDKA